jgi:excisionase family DNA binding protein
MADHVAAPCEPPPEIAALALILTIGDVCRALQVHDRTVRRWIADGLLRARRAGGRVRILRSELARFLGVVGGAA